MSPLHLALHIHDTTHDRPLKHPQWHGEPRGHRERCTAHDGDFWRLRTRFRHLDPASCGAAGGGCER